MQPRGLGDLLSTVEGRRGRHARVVILTILREELMAVRKAFGANTQIHAADREWGVQAGRQQPFVVRRCAGRGNQDAASATSRAIEKWRPELIIVCGIAGGIGKMRHPGAIWEGPVPGDVLLGDYVHYAHYTKTTNAGHSMRYCGLDHPADGLVGQSEDLLLENLNWHDYIAHPHPLHAPRNPSVRRGEILATETILSGPRREEQKDLLNRFDHAEGVDMESRGVARAVHERRDNLYYNPRWLSVRGMSDRVWAAAEDEPEPDREPDHEREQFRLYAAATAAAATRRILEDFLATKRTVPSGLSAAPAYRFPSGRGLKAEADRLMSEQTEMVKP